MLNHQLDFREKVELRNPVLFQLPPPFVITTTCRGKGSNKSFIDPAFKKAILVFFPEFVLREARVKAGTGLGCRGGCTSNVDTKALYLVFIFFLLSAKAGLVKVEDSLNCLL